MDREQLIRQLMATFLGELEEHVQTLNRGLLALEQPETPSEERGEILRALFRAAHSLKGASRSVSVGPLEAACHRLEDLLKAVLDERLSLDTARFQLFFATADAIDDAGRRLREGRDLAGSPLAGILSRLDTAVVGIPAAAAGVPRPAAPRRAAAPERPGGPAPGSPGGGPVPAAGAPAGGTTSPSLAEAERFVRLSAEKLDALLRQSGELMMARAARADRAEDLTVFGGLIERHVADWRRLERRLHRLVSRDTGTPGGLDALVARTSAQVEQIARDLGRLVPAFRRDEASLERAAADLDHAAFGLRMVAFGLVEDALRRTARDSATTGGKLVDLVLEGGQVEMDRAVFDALRDPLLHLVRNAIDHGIEPALDRAARGKRERGRVVVAAGVRGEELQVSVSDDGQGLEVEAIRARARELGLPEPSDAAEAARLILRSGFSTSLQVTPLSGRGVGLDVVRTHVEALHGDIRVSPGAGAGLTVVLTLPLTLAKLRVVLVRAGDDTVAFAVPHVRRLLRTQRTAMARIGGHDTVALDGRPVRVAWLHEVLGSTPPPPGRDAAAPIMLVAIGAGRPEVALAVDAVLAEQEVIVRPVVPRLRALPLAAALTVLPGGGVSFILSGAGVVRAALAAEAAVSQPPGPAAVRARRRLLLAEDSITTRSLERSILEAAGYEVRVAVDGAEAWDMLHAEPVELLVADIEMPRMDGFSLTEAIRQDSRLRHLPVILVTSLESGEDRARGLRAGADAYLVKSAFDQRELLATIEQLI